MDHTNHTVMLYSSQAKAVTQALRRDGVCFSKREYVRGKYEESAPIFLAAYDWFVAEMQAYLPKPEAAQYPYWAFRDLYSVEKSAGSELLQLCVPVEQAVFFDMYDWNRLLRLQYIGETEEEEQLFRRQLGRYGVKREMDIILTNFYPDLKQQVQNSWKRLFRHHEAIKSGNDGEVGSIQAALWQLKKEWVV